jgi:hypothetical protein
MAEIILFRGNIDSLSQLAEYVNLCNFSYMKYERLELRLTPKYAKKEFTHIDVPVTMVLERNKDHFNLSHLTLDISLKEQAAVGPIYEAFQELWSKSQKKKIGNTFEIESGAEELVSKIQHCFETYVGMNSEIYKASNTHLSAVAKQAETESHAAYATPGLDDISLKIQNKYKKPEKKKKEDAEEKEDIKNSDKLTITFKLNEDTGYASQADISLKVAGMDWLDSMQELLCVLFGADYLSVDGYAGSQSMSSEPAEKSLTEIIMHLCRIQDESTKGSSKKEKAQMSNVLFRGMVDNIEQISGYFSFLSNAYPKAEKIGMNLSSPKGEINLMLVRKESKFTAAHAYFTEDNAQFNMEDLSKGAHFVYKQMKKILNATAVTIKAVQDAHLSKVNVPLGEISLNAFLLELFRIFQEDTRSDLEPISE